MKRMHARVVDFAQARASVQFAISFESALMTNTQNIICSTARFTPSGVKPACTAREENAR
jgi:hypothetical protein